MSIQPLPIDTTPDPENAEATLYQQVVEHLTDIVQTRGFVRESPLGDKQEPTYPHGISFYAVVKTKEEISYEVSLHRSNAEIPRGEGIQLYVDSVKETGMPVLIVETENPIGPVDLSSDANNQWLIEITRSGESLENSDRIDFLNKLLRATVDREITQERFNSLMRSAQEEGSNLPMPYWINQK